MIEQFKILLLNRANKVLGIFTVSTGGVAGTVADHKVIFVTGLKEMPVHSFSLTTIHPVI